MSDQHTHSEIGGSSCARYMACPGSVKLSRGIPRETSSDAAEEGTKAHGLAELGLRNVLGNPSMPAPLFTDNYVPLPGDRDAVLSYIDYVAGIYRGMKEKDAGVVFGIEEKFNMDTIHPQMYGTADFWCYSPGKQELVVVDLKFGVGVEVHAKGNKQAMFYALGVLLGIQRPVKTVRICIHQPRLPLGDKVKESIITVDDLVVFMEELKKAAYLATDGENPPLATGDHCRFCPAIKKCPAIQGQVAKVTLNDVEKFKTIEEKLAVLPVLKNFIKSVESEMQALAAEDRLPEGYKKVARRGTRKWTHSQKETEWKLLKAGVEIAEIKELVSPAQAEKRLPKEQRKLVKGLCQIVSSGYTWAPEKSSRPPVITAKERFSGVNLEYKESNKGGK